MAVGKNYLKEVQKFATSQYWHSGMRITAGIFLPLIFLILTGRIAAAIPFLWGALFVSLTDTPGPIHHRRNGMIAAILLNTAVVLLTSFTKEYQGFLILQIIGIGFLLSMGAIFSARAGAIGTLALIVMLLNLLSIHNEYNTVKGSILIAAGGLWYMVFSLLLYKIRPYRAVEQSLGELLIAIADYVRARGGFYKEGAEPVRCFDRVMTTQSTVQDIQNQTQAFLFNTRQLLGDASPKSRSLMMIYLDSVDLFEQAMYAYQDYALLHKTLDHTGLPNRYYGLILEVSAALEHIGLSVQMGSAVKKNIDLTRRLDDLERLTLKHVEDAVDPNVILSLEALGKIFNNVYDICNRINKIVLYTRLAGEMTNTSFEQAQKISQMAATQPLNFRIFRENLTLKSDIFRHALRLTIAMIIAYVVSVIFSLSHSYWVLLTIVTILKPAYAISRERNISRLGGTLVGVILVSIILYLTTNNTLLMAVMMVSMLLGFSLLRIQYFGFVVFLTIFVIISIYFLNPDGFQPMIRERLVDTAIGSLVAFLASRFIFPVWTQDAIKDSMEKMIEANQHYFWQAWIAVKNKKTVTPAYTHARQDAIVSLTNLSDKFQHMLSEPQQTSQASPIHQFVIASHMLTGHIAALSTEELWGRGNSNELEEMAKSISLELQCAQDNLRDKSSQTDIKPNLPDALSRQSLAQLSMIFALAHDIRKISARVSA